MWRQLKQVKARLKFKIGLFLEGPPGNTLLMLEFFVPNGQDSGTELVRRGLGNTFIAGHKLAQINPKLLNTKRIWDGIGCITLVRVFWERDGFAQLLFLKEWKKYDTTKNMSGCK